MHHKVYIPRGANLNQIKRRLIKVISGITDKLDKKVVLEIEGKFYGLVEIDPRKIERLDAAGHVGVYNHPGAF